MKTIAIIAEYNPFHLGHLAQFEAVFQKFGKNTRIVNIMSPQFVQRGEASILDQYTRAKLAVEAGSALVLSMPVVFATASAAFFARAGVEIISRTNIATIIACGAENFQDVTLLRSLANCLAEESEAYQIRLKHFLEEGYNFGEARQLTLEEIFPDQASKIREFLKRSNNILALEYQIAILRENQKRQAEGLSPLELVLLERTGSEHGTNQTGIDVSAREIREILKATQNKTTRIEALINKVPAHTLSKLLDEKLVLENPLISFLPHLLASRDDEKASQFRDMDIALAARIRNTTQDISRGDRSIAELASSKNYPETRVKRALLSWAFGITEDKWGQAVEDGPLFTKVLAYDRNGQYLLKRIRNQSGIRLINKYSDLFDNKTQGRTAAWQIQGEINAENYYNHLRNI